MKSLSLILLLFLPLSAWGQERLTLSARPTSEAVQTAKDLIKSAETTPTKLVMFGYALIDIKIPGKLSTYIAPGADDCLQQVKIAKGTVYEGLLAGPDGIVKWTRIEAVDYDRVLVVGVKTGQATLIWMGVKGDEAVVIAAFQFAVGKPAPKPVEPPDDPVVPVDDDLTKGMRAAFAKDTVAGIGEKKWLLPMAGIYEAASKDSLDSIKTAGDLDNLLTAARIAAGIPDPDKTLTETRHFIKRQLLANLTGGVDAPATVLDAAKKTLAKSLMGKVAESLERLAK